MAFQKIFLTTVLAFVFLIVFALPVLAQGLVPCGLSADDPSTTDIDESADCTLCHGFVLFDNVVKYVLFDIVPIVAILMIVIGGVMMMLSYSGGLEDLGGGQKGGPAMLSSAKKLFTSVAVGLIIIYGAWLIINLFLFTIGATSWAGFGQGWWIIDCELEPEEGNGGGGGEVGEFNGGGEGSFGGSGASGSWAPSLWDSMSSTEQYAFVRDPALVKGAKDILLNNTWFLTDTGDLLLIPPPLGSGYYKVSPNDFREAYNFVMSSVEPMARQAAQDNTTSEGAYLDFADKLATTRSYVTDRYWGPKKDWPAIDPELDDTENIVNTNVNPRDLYIDITNIFY